MSLSSPKRIQKRNIVVLGKSGSGKSTIANRIVGAEVFRVARSVDGVTKRPQYEETEYGKDGFLYKIKVMDTVGLFDPSRDNKAVIREAKDFFRKNTPEGLSLVLFVLREGRFTPEEKETFALLTKNFHKEKVNEISALIVTNCENFDKEEREALKRDLRESAQTKSMCEFMHKGIFTVGFPATKTAKVAAKPIFAESALKDQETLRDLVRECEGKMMLTEELLSDSFWEKVGKLCQIL